MCGVAESEIQKKIHTLRSQFVKESRKRGKSGSGLDEVKKWKFFDVLRFLQPFIQTSTSSSTLSNLLPECPEAVSVFLILFSRVSSRVYVCI